MADLKRFFKKTVSEDRHKQAASVSVPEGLWIKCPKCGEMVYREDVISTHRRWILRLLCKPFLRTLDI